MYSQKLYTIIVYGGTAKQIKTTFNALFVAEILPCICVFLSLVYCLFSSILNSFFTKDAIELFSSSRSEKSLASSLLSVLELSMD